MAKVHVCNVLVLDNPTQFMSKLEFEITFECIEDLPEDLEWKIIYVGSAESEEFDQILDTVYVGPVPEGRHKFVFTADPPNPHKIPVSDVVGVTVILITCAYRGQVSFSIIKFSKILTFYLTTFPSFFQEFIRVGYYVSNEYNDPELQETPPEQPAFDKLTRNILASNPRVTKFKINWDNPNSQVRNSRKLFHHSFETQIQNVVFFSKTKTMVRLLIPQTMLIWKMETVVVLIRILTKTNLQNIPLEILMHYHQRKIPCSYHPSNLVCLLEFRV